jgi:hypothetical protein
VSKVRLYRSLLYVALSQLCFRLRGLLGTQLFPEAGQGGGGRSRGDFTIMCIAHLEERLYVDEEFSILWGRQRDSVGLFGDYCSGKKGSLNAPWHKKYFCFTDSHPEVSCAAQ